MATLRTALPFASPTRPPSRPRMNSTLTLVTPDKAQALLDALLPGPAPAAPASCALSYGT